MWGIFCSISGCYSGQGKSKTNLRLTVWHVLWTYKLIPSYTSQDNCSIYSPKLCCCFLPVQSHSSRSTTHRVSIWTLHRRCVLSVDWLKSRPSMELTTLSFQFIVYDGYCFILALTATWHAEHSLSSVITVFRSYHLLPCQPLLFSEWNVLLIIKQYWNR